MTAAAGEDALFDVAPYRVKPYPDLLDELAAIEARGAAAAVEAPHDPWKSVGPDPASISAWQVTMARISPSKLWNPDYDSGSDQPLIIDAHWAELDLARVAGGWRASGFTPEEAVAWKESLSPDNERWRTVPSLAADWRDRGFTPSDARMWVDGDLAPEFGAELAERYRDADWHPYHAWSLRIFRKQVGDWRAERDLWVALPVYHALNCARAGFTPAEAAELVDVDECELARLLELRHDVRGPIDSFEAMDFNNRVRDPELGWSDTAPSPFWERRLWDCQDESDDAARRRGEREPIYGGPYAKKPRWKEHEERAEREKAEAAHPNPELCPGSGGAGTLEFRDGWEEWWVHCPVCGVTWMGGNGDPLPEHTQRRG